MSRDPNTMAPQISQAAAEWFLSMREPQTSPEVCAAFGDWLRASPVHVRAYLDVARLWEEVEQVDASLLVAADAASLSTNVLPLCKVVDSNLSASATLGAAPNGGRRQRRFRLRPYPMAMTALLLMALLLVGRQWWLPSLSYATEVGEQRVLTLEDGSIIRLNSRSQVLVRMSPEQRSIELVHGQALFEVAKDPRRPFVVTSGEVATRAVGTQFDVYRKPASTVVTVVEGQVEVLATVADRAVSGGHARAASIPVSLKAGEQVTVSRAGAIARHRDANVNAATRWLRQELVFEDQPLSAVVEEFNRYQRVPIILADPTLGEVRVNAVFNTTAPEHLLRFIRQMDHVVVHRDSDQIRIERAH